ncbi:MULTISPECIES: hypothetical protein [unclassified Moorena]|uniref:hypothetical protein n=1 Tax=unclassified Moorena TaxID=2683338 RepID=UPI00144F2C17|nr:MULTISPECIES: hypothetical protein [unclassified Moorena]NEQ56266.1 hypothetical protein [Moorena sp. SIO4A1]
MPVTAPYFLLPAPYSLYCNKTMEDFPYSSTLGQRLQRRLVKPAGVINTQQLHSHYQATQSTAGRLVQKSMLPEQVKFRYGSGVLQPTAIMSRLQRQRTESAEGFDGQWRVNPDGYSGTGKTAQTFVQTQPRAFQNSRDNSRKIVGKSPTAIGVADSGYDSAPLAPQFWGEQNSESPPKLGDLGGLTKTRRSPIHTSIQQRPAISQKVTVMTKPLVKKTNHNQSTSPVSLVEKKPKSASSTPLGKTIQETGDKGNRRGTQPQLKINRKATLAEVNTLSRHESHTVQAQRDTKSSTKSSTNPTVTQTKPETSSSSSPPYPEKSGTLRISRKATMTAANASNVARVQSKSIPDLPLAQTNSPSSSSTVSRKEDSSDTVIQTKSIPNQAKSVKITSPGDSVNNSPQNLPLAKTASASSPSQVSRKEDNEDTVIQAKLSPTSGKIISQSPTINQASNSKTISHSNSSPDLPLAKTTSASSPSQVSRKEDNEDTVIQAKLSPTSGKKISQSPTVNQASNSKTISHSNSSPDLPLAKTTSASSPSQVSRKEDNEDTVIQAKIIPNSGKIISQSPTINQASHSQTISHSKSITDLPLAKTTSASSPTTVSRKEDNDETVIQAKVIPNQPKLGQITSQGDTISKANHSQTIIHSNSSPNLPLAKTNSPSYQSTIQAKNQPLSKRIIQTKLAEKNYQPTGIIKKQQENSPVQLSQKASIASNPSVVSTTPTQLSSSSELNRVWLKTTNTIEANTIEASKGLSSTSSNHQKLPLPLAITQIKPNGAIARQTNAVENSTVQAKSGNATTPMSTPETASASGIDLIKVAEQVSRILARKLMVERERRGIEKWH